MKRGDEIDLRLEDFAYPGKTVGHVDGRVVFVHGGVAGDTVRVRINKAKRNYCEAVTVALLSPSSLRVEPRCRYFGVCGGCTWQHAGYQAQLVFKRQHVVESLEHIGGFKEISVNPTIGADGSYFYRNKMEFSFGPRWRTREEMERQAGAGAASPVIDELALGLHTPTRFDRVLDLEECFLQSETSVRIVNTVRAFCRERELSYYSTRSHEGYLRNLVIREGKNTGDLMVNLVTREDRPDIMSHLTGRLLEAAPGITTIVNNITDRLSQVAIGKTEHVYHGPGYITETIGSRSYRISANTFFQTNTAQAERLYDAAKRMAKLEPGDLVLDLYCGAGTIALHVADEAAEVIGIETSAISVSDAERNAAMNGVRNCRFVCGDLKEKLIRTGDWLAPGRDPDVVIVDPPRAGMHEKVTERLIGLHPRRIVYVSCNPATQARDLRLLATDGIYAVDEAQPVDMFPHTDHIENVVSLGLVHRANPRSS